MAKYRKLPVVIEASQWFKNGDHPLDGDVRFTQGKYMGELYEGQVVRYYRTPDMDSQNKCKHCGVIMHCHGWIDTLEGGHIVCPSDWIITGVKGEHYPCKPDIFAATYEPASTPQQEAHPCQSFELRSDTPEEGAKRAYELGSELTFTKSTAHTEAPTGQTNSIKSHIGDMNCTSCKPAPAPQQESHTDHGQDSPTCNSKENDNG